MKLRDFVRLIFSIENTPDKISEDSANPRLISFEETLSEIPTLISIDDFLEANPDWKELLNKESDAKRAEQPRTDAIQTTYNVAVQPTIPVYVPPPQKIIQVAIRPRIPKGYTSIESVVRGYLQPNTSKEEVSQITQDISVILRNYSGQLLIRNIGTVDSPHYAVPNFKRMNLDNIFMMDRDIRQLLGK